MNKKILAALFSLTLAGPASADDLIQAHPVAWHVHTGHSEITLLGSLHMLPANTAWLTPDLTRSINRSDVFVFEVPTDQSSRAALNTMIASRGTLPDGLSLRAMLPPESRADFDAAMAAEHMSPAAMDREQPWLAALHLTLADTMNRNFFPDAGVDYVVMNWANRHNRQVRYLETVDQQLAMLVPNSGESSTQLDEFAMALKKVGREENLDPLLQAWGEGDIARLDSMIATDFDGHPDARKRLLTDRNRDWANQIEQMSGEWRNFFVVVGAAHLAGPDGVPALLRKDGFQVDGP